MVNRFIDEKHIRNFFSMLNDADVRYMLLKNIADELPYKLKNGKDIDIFVNNEDMSKFSKKMDEYGWLYRVHPLGREAGYSFAYKLPECQFWQLGGIEETFYVDVCYKLMCKSLTPKVWVPLNDLIQEQAWKLKEWNDELQCWQLGEKVLFSYLFARCVFDKRTFDELYIAEIEKRKHLLDDTEVHAMLETIFYRFTDTLISLVKKSDYGAIMHSYITFEDY